MTNKRLVLITTGILLSLFLASMEGTVVATAMPTIVGQLGGLSIYAWVFSIYLLASTTSVPLYGKLSDLYGRKRIYLISMGLFLVGSVLCAQARSMQQLILFRAVQGLGAGGVLPLAFTIVGELFTLEQRARMQGLFSGVWGVSSVIGPLIGGFLVDRVSWHWVFYINLIPGLLAIAVVGLVWQDRPATEHPSVDYLGAALLTLAVLSLLLGLDRPTTPPGIAFLSAAVLLFAALAWAERRAPDPILPLQLFRDRLFLIAILHGVLAGWAMFGSLNYVPLFVQAVLEASATQAGISLTPMSLTWTLFSILASWLLLRVSYRALALAGMVILSVGALFMSRIGASTHEAQVMLYTALMGAGMGLSIPAFLIAVQSSVPRASLGSATSTVQFSRSIGGTLGVSVLGAALSSGLAARLAAAGLDPASVSIDALLDPLSSAAASASPLLRAALGQSIASIFVIAFAAALLGLGVVFFTPRGKVGDDR